MTAPRRGSRLLPRTENIHMGQNDHVPSSRYSLKTTLRAEKGAEAGVGVGVDTSQPETPQESPRASANRVRLSELQGWGWGDAYRTSH